MSKVDGLWVIQYYVTGDRTWFVCDCTPFNYAYTTRPAALIAMEAVFKYMRRHAAGDWHKNKYRVVEYVSTIEQ